MKVAHLLKHFEPGGIEKWLVDLTSFHGESDSDLEIDFIMQTTEDAFFDEDIVNNGGSLIKLDFRRLGLIRYLYSLFCIFREQKYDVVHSHFYHFSGLILFIAWLAGVKIRVSHCHNDKSGQNCKAGIVKKCYLAICVLLNKLFANRKIAVSKQAAISLFSNVSDVAIIPCGLRFKTKLAIPSDIEKNGEIFLLNVGSFSYQKNHDFMLKIAERLKEKDVRFKFYLVGAGEAWEEIEQICIQKKLNENIIFLGKRKDVQNIMENCVDFFLFPSRYEGLGLAAIESQYYGIRTIVTDNLPKELNVSSYIKRLPIDDLSIDAWVEHICNTTPINEYDMEKCRRRIEDSNLSVENNYRAILEFYRFN
ncbi:glycosyl hydrolase family 1 [Enterovibrio norvegicus FF-162]|uniref:glycosyltransferase n=1 Tax=Enterovibrio norvegicus TaxID=188144 RepID=UPI0002D8BE76|nr:glycosyltransferase [Enterovibrio norvegicus]OEE86164.1 glycosyl hydrolase family 1 [Enterovibrio norvegicus FF-162]